MIRATEVMPLLTKGFLVIPAMYPQGMPMAKVNMVLTRA